jgi:asparagine synthase (glutamine-hydrolysing)
MLEPSFFEQVDVEGPMKLLREAYQRPKVATMLQRMMHLDLKITLADNDLRKVNRMCRLAGIDVRYPFLEDEIVAFSASVPSELLLPGVKLRHFFKQAMRGFLPDAVLTKEKHGFGLPFDIWIKTDADLQALVLDHLSAFKGRGYLRNPFIDEIINGCRTTEPRPTDSMAWDIAMLEIWLSKHT